MSKKFDIVQHSKNASQLIFAIKNKFCEITKDESVFFAEAIYAKQSISNSESLSEIAALNPSSFKTAFLQLATSSLTLDPAQKLAYLIPRDKQVILDVSYRGLMKMAVEGGMCKNLIVDLVFAKDQFTFKGRRTPPEHNYDPFADIGNIIIDNTDKGSSGERGDFRGVYVDYLLNDDSHLVYFITKRDISSARLKSSAYLYSKTYCVWTDFPVQMIRKVAIKSSIHLLPNSNKALMATIDYLNSTGGEGFNKKTTVSIEAAAYDVTHSMRNAESAEVIDVEASVSQTGNSNDGNTLRDKIKKRIDKIVMRCSKTLAFKSTLEELSKSFDFTPAEIDYAKTELEAAREKVFYDMLTTAIRQNDFKKVKDFLEHYDPHTKETHLKTVNSVIEQLQECRILYRSCKKQKDMTELDNKLNTIQFKPLSDHIRSML